MHGLTILVIEDEAAIVRALEPTLKANGATVRIAWSGSQGLEYLKREAIDLAICDLGLPDVDGHELIGEIRSLSEVPIIVLSARGQEEDRVAALDAGADDFVPKPFSSSELMARIRAAVRRRSPTNSSTSLKLGQLEVDLTTRRVILDGEEIRLSGREHALLRLLALSPHGVATHREIIDRIWGPNASAETQSVRVLVGQLRQKVEEDPSAPRLICTEPGVGYRLRTS
jgi:two-component system KDP operon response regulator KdpE